MGKGRAGNHERGGTLKKVDVSHAHGAGVRGSALGLHGVVPGRAGVLTASLPTQLRHLEKAPLSSCHQVLRRGPAAARREFSSTALIVFASGPQSRCLSVPRPCPGGTRQRRAHPGKACAKVCSAGCASRPSTRGVMVGGKGCLIFLYSFALSHEAPYPAGRQPGDSAPVRARRSPDTGTAPSTETPAP